MQAAPFNPTARPRAARRGLGYDLFGLLCAKAVLLGLLYFVFFGPAHHVATGPGAVSAHVYGEMIK